MNKAVRIIIYVVWGLFSLLVCLYLTFPTDLARDVVKKQAEARLTGYRVDIDALSLVGLSGVSLSGVRLLPLAGLTPTPEGGEAGAAGAATDATTGNATTAAPAPARAAGGGGGDEPGRPAANGDEGPPQLTLPTLIDRARVTVNLLGLLGGHLEAAFDVSLGGGTIYGSWAPNPDTAGQQRFDLNIDSVALGQIGFLSNATGAPMTGTATGHVVLNYEGRVLRGGSVELRVDDLARGAGPLPIPGLPAPPYIETPTRMGQLTLDADLDGSQLNVRTFQAIGGPDLEFQLGGRVDIRNPLPESIVYFTLQIGFSEDWKTGNAFGPIIEQVPLLRESCTPDNQCALAMRGVISQLRPQPLAGGR